MEIELEDVSSVEKRLSITVPFETVDRELENAFRELQREVELPGFRRGRVPRKLLEQRFAQTAASEVAAKLVDSALEEALMQHELAPLGTPEIDSGPVLSGHPFRFTARVEIRPEPRIGSYEGVRLVRSEPRVSDEELDELIDSMRRQHGVLEEVEERRPATDGDVVDVTLTLSDETYGDLVRKHQLITVPDDAAHGFLLSVLRGLEPGEQGQAEVTVPGDYVERDWVGRRCRAEVLVHGIKTLRLPPLDDDFARAMGHETVSDLRQALHGGILDSKIRRAREREARQLIEAIIERNPFEVPPTMVSGRAQTLVDSIAARLTDGMSRVMKPTLDDLDETKREQLRDEALFSVRRELVLEAVVRQQGIRLEETEVDAQVARLAGQAGRRTDELRRAFRQGDAMAELEAKMLADKAVDWLLERAEIVEQG